MGLDLEVLIRDAVRQVVREELRSALAELRPAPSPGEFLTVAQAAEIAQVAVDTLRRWIASGRLQAHHAGRELRVSRAALESFMAGTASTTLTPEAAVDLALARRRR